MDLPKKWYGSTNTSLTVHAEHTERDWKRYYTHYGNMGRQVSMGGDTKLTHSKENYCVLSVSIVANCQKMKKK